MLKTIKFRNGVEIQKNLCSSLSLTIKDKTTGNWFMKTNIDSPLTITHGKAYRLIMKEDTKVSEDEGSVIIETEYVEYYIHTDKH